MTLLVIILIKETLSPHSITSRCCGDVSLDMHLLSMLLTCLRQLKISCFTEVIQHKILKEVHQQRDFTRGFYGIQTDEVTGVSN